MAKYLVLGKGRSGSAAAALLEAQGHTVDFADGYAGVIASPGLVVKSELQLGCEELKKRGWKLLAVTGSKGKSSVVKIVADAINRAGGHAVACGNYGVPVTSLLGECPPLRSNGGTYWAIVEVSSFMMETTTLQPDTFEAAVILNLQEDHLDRHGSVEVYHGLKKRLLTFAKKTVEAPPPGSNGGTDNGDEELIKGSYFDNAILRANGFAAVELLRVAGLSDGEIADAFAHFEPLPHRMNLIGEFGGVRYIDDSKATSLAALAAGVEMAGASVRLIAGGLPKGDDPKSVLPILTNRVKKVYLIGQCAEVFAAAWKSTVDCEVVGTMERAVKAAVNEAEEGETVLLSPGTASFDQFKSYGERGDVFADLVKREGKEK